MKSFTFRFADGTVETVVANGERAARSAAMYQRYGELGWFKAKYRGLFLHEGEVYTLPYRGDGLVLVSG